MRKPNQSGAMLSGFVLVGVLAALAGCNANPPATPAASDAPDAPAKDASRQTGNPASTRPPAQTPPPADQPLPAFADKVWRVEQAGGPVEKGSTYSFLAGGTLVETSPHGTPMSGRWSYGNGTLTMTEEGISYPTDVVLLDATHFTFRSHNPGGTVEVATMLATDVSLPTGQ